MKPPGPSRMTTASAAWAVHTPGLRPLPGRRSWTKVPKILKLQVFLVLNLFVPVTSEPVRDHLPDLQRWEQNPSERLCQAGFYLSQETGTCKPCSAGIGYTSFPNKLSSCLLCSHCKKDKEEKSKCNSTRNTECQCKSGTFEDKDSPEFCKTCSDCTDREDEVISCTPKTDRKCEPKSTWTAPLKLGLGIGIPILAVLVLTVALVRWKTQIWSVVLQYMKRVCSGREQDPESGNAVRLSLMGPQMSSLENDSHHNAVSPAVKAPEEPAEAENSPTGRKLLVPENGIDPIDALNLIFNYCQNVVPYNSWDHLMRQMGLRENDIQVVRAETQAAGDALYQMLQKWLNQKGRGASINDLLDALEALGERYALDTIEEYAVKSKKFFYQKTTAQPGVVTPAFDPSTQETETGDSL